MAKRNHKLALLRTEQGQISIFFSASLVVMISIIAFVINIGLFVKAKINLQNATDSAAYAGAAVQARQLTKIAYLNWEMRNIYKEWMYKYYVIGNLNIPDVENPSGNGVMKFNLQEDRNPITGVITKDIFNIPAVCIHIAGSKTNICKRYSVPGLPEFGSSNLPGAEEASRAFMDTLISTKVNDCIDRTRLNMTVANTWTYNVLGNSMDASLAGRGPAILSDKQGAWPKAVELALRIRNLEYVMNRPAETSGICSTGSTGTGLTRCSRSIDEIEQEKKLGNERIIKAFYSGYRNLGNADDVEMKQSFTLSEIPPQGVKFERDEDASNLLIPSEKKYEKQWVNLKLMMVNYAIFYAAMIPRADDKTSGACDISKVAIPVPGYPMGFYKDPDVLTYYAVKGEAEFTGMFNPFNEGVVKLQAYAAAKPFGGRIGPMLFTQKENENYIVGRTDSQKRRSMPYITSYKFDGVTIRTRTYNESGGSKFIPGLPLPTNSKEAPGSFWLEDADRPIGGKLADAQGVQFGVPNMVYDYQEDFKITGYSSLAKKIHEIDAKNPDSEEPIGLFSKYQFNKFKGDALGSAISPQTLDEEIARVRAPTKYEAANYLIPTPNKWNLGNALESFGFISGQKEELSNGIDRYTSFVYAPLYKSNDQQDLIFSNPSEVTRAIFEFMGAQKTGMTKYKMSLNKAAINIWKEKDRVAGGASGSKPGYERAARGVSDLANFDNDDVNQMPQSCNSLAGQFLYFYYGEVVDGSMAPANPEGCPKPLGRLIEEYFAKQTSDPTYNPNYYTFAFSWNRNMPSEEGMKMLTAYMPGPFTGVGSEGNFSNPISGAGDTMRRNSYSTKFISLDSLQSGSGPRWDNPQFLIMAEGDPGAASSSPDITQKNYRNPPNFNHVDADISSIKY